MVAHYNLQAALCAYSAKRFFVARACALTAKDLLAAEKLSTADRTYLTYYAVMIARLATASLGGSLQNKGEAYPPLSKEQVEAVDPRWRFKFPLVQIDPEKVP